MMNVPKLILMALRVAGAAYVGMCLLVLIFQERYIYHPDRDVDLSRGARVTPEDVRLTTADGERLGAWFVPANPTNRLNLTLLFCHGNGGDIGNCIWSAETFHDLGFDVLVFDYRGFGASTGKPSEKGTYKDVDAAWDYLTAKRGIPPDRIVIFGRSLGGPIASELAARVNPRALVLESAFTSALDMGKKMFPFLPARLICRYGYDTVAKVRKVTCPVLVAHSRTDGTVPFSMGVKVFEAANNPKRFVEFRGGHNDGGMDSDESYRREFMRFLQ